MRVGFHRAGRGIMERDWWHILFVFQHFRTALGRSGQPSEGVQDSKQNETFLGSGVPFSSIQFHSLILI